MPRSPWLASAGWTKLAGVPVDANVAAILRATWPLLPIPVTMTRPVTFSRISESAAEPLVERLDEGADAGCFEPQNASCRSQSALRLVGQRKSRRLRCHCRLRLEVRDVER